MHNKMSLLTVYKGKFVVLGFRKQRIIKNIPTFENQNLIHRLISNLIS